MFLLAQDELGIPRGSIKATVLIETILAAFEMDEILYELREHSAGLNAGRWDYIFSVIKKFRERGLRAPRPRPGDDGGAVHARLHRPARPAPATGAARTRSAAWPRSSPRAATRRSTRSALAKVREDKERESGNGFDGTWVAHPDLVPVAREIFDGVLGERPNQVERQRDDVARRAPTSCSTSRSRAARSPTTGLRTNVSVGVRYLHSWLSGVGAAAIDNLMEDAATAEISRSQVWQWVRHGRFTASGCARRSPPCAKAWSRRRSCSSGSRSTTTSSSS